MMIRDISCDHLRGMMVYANLIEKPINNICKLKVNVIQIWHSKSRYATSNCRLSRHQTNVDFQTIFNDHTKKITLKTGCDQLNRADETSSMSAREHTEEVKCNETVTFRVFGCCWIPYLDEKGSYDAQFKMPSILRLDETINRAPQFFIPPALRVPIEKKEKSIIHIFDPDYDRIKCRGPIQNVDCQTCFSLDTLRNEYKDIVKINDDCTILTDFPASLKNSYFKVMFVVEEYEGTTDRILSQSANLLLMIPAELKCGERGQTTMEIEPNDPKYIPGKTYTLITKTKPPCGEVSYKKSIFSVAPPGSRLGSPNLENGIVTQNMTFIADHDLCQQMMQICAYSMDAENFQSESVCEKIFCRGYEHLLGNEQILSSPLNRKKKAVIISCIAIATLLATTALLAFFLWKRFKNKEEDESEQDSSVSQSEESAESSNYVTKTDRKPQSSAVSSGIYDDDED